ncbi:hypothetical protein Pint_31899 [Pistacia integerrima]|uniref:Uncharacterized protein n=1 Tax=Pistacia integerrima TaxID=434235 RepID=A0ACC0XPR5_9ROSI|nr:hypothetical protein Pint_31899 [Pistacia integerrima]
MLWALTVCGSSDFGKLWKSPPNRDYVSCGEPSPNYTSPAPSSGSYKWRTQPDACWDKYSLQVKKARYISSASQETSKNLTFEAPNRVLLGMVSKTAIVVLIGLLGMVYQATQLPPPHSLNDPPVTSPRIRLTDGRLAGAALIVPVINYQWPSLPHSLIRLDYRRRLVLWSLWISKYAPGLLHWWVTQKWFPSTSVLEKNPVFFNHRDIEVLKKIKGFPMLTPDRLQDRGVFDTLRDDFLVGFGDWEFDPMELSNPFPQNESSVHIWQGYEDKVVPFQIQRYISGKLGWIEYHEVADGGHLIVHYNGLCDAVLKALLVGKDSLVYKPSTA